MVNKITAFVLGLLVLISINLSCSKQNDVKQDVSIDEKNLTDCPLNSTCAYGFETNSDVDSARPFIKSGAYRVFWSSKVTSYDESFLFIKAPMKGTSFTLDLKAILNGNVTLIRSCPACNLVGLKIIDGYVKGINLTPDKSEDQAKWIVEAMIIQQAIDYSAYKDTVYVKQYFYPKKAL